LKGHAGGLGGGTVGIFSVANHQALIGGNTERSCG
jgi:hypothetical protein